MEVTEKKEADENSHGVLEATALRTLRRRVAGDVLRHSYYFSISVLIKYRMRRVVER